MTLARKQNVWLIGQFSHFPPFSFSFIIFSSVQSLSHVWLFVTPWNAAPQASLSITNSWSLVKLMSVESVMPSNHFILFRPLFLLPSIFPSIMVFSNESIVRIRWPKDWSFSFIISPSNEYSGLISFRMNCLDLLEVQRTLKSLLQHHSSKASILRHSAFFIVQLAHPYMTTGKVVYYICGWIKFHSMDIPYFVYLVNCWWHLLALLVYLSYT